MELIKKILAGINFCEAFIFAWKTVISLDLNKTEINPQISCVSTAPATSVLAAIQPFPVHVQYL